MLATVLIFILRDSALDAIRPFFVPFKTYIHFRTLECSCGNTL
jgi:hypothetical protein